METFIIVTALIASAAGAGVLLLSLANKRSQLVKAYNIKRQIEERERQIEENRAKMQVQASASKMNGAATVLTSD